MPLPNLIHKTLIKIKQLDTSNTVYDEDFREPIGQSARYAEKSIYGQVRWTTKDSVSYDYGGTILTSYGYILFRYVDLTAASITLQRHDRITKMGHLDVDLYVISFVPCGHYLDQNGPTLVKVYFTDKQPSRN